MWKCLWGCCGSKIYNQLSCGFNIRIWLSCKWWNSDEPKGDEANDIDKQPPPIAKLQDVHDCVQMIFNFILDNHKEFGKLNVMNIWKLLGNLQ